MVGIFQRIKKQIRPRLRGHQMRPEDDPKDLMDGEQMPRQPADSCAQALTSQDGTFKLQLSDDET